MKVFLHYAAKNLNERKLPITINYNSIFFINAEKGIIYERRRKYG